MRARPCRSCKTRIPFNARFCPFCYRPQWWAIAAMAAAVLVLVVSAGGFIAWKSMTPAADSKQGAAEVREEAQQVQSMPTWKEAGRQEAFVPEDMEKEEILVPVIESGAVREQAVTSPPETEKEHSVRARTEERKKEAKPSPVPASTVNTRKEKPRSVEAQAENPPTPKTVAESPAVREQQREAGRERATPTPASAEEAGVEKSAEAPVPARAHAGDQEETPVAEAQAGGPEAEEILTPQAQVGGQDEEGTPSLGVQTEKTEVPGTETR